METISFGPTQIISGERNNTAFVSILREGDLAGTVVAEVRTGDDTAVAGTDYVATVATITFGPGETQKAVSVPIRDDALAEGSESFSVQLLSVTGGTVGFPRTTRVVIEDDEIPSGATVPDPSSLTITPETAIVSGLREPTAFAFVPGQPTILVIAEKSGLIRVAEDGVLRDMPLLDLRPLVNDVRDRGLIDIELHPQFVSQPYLYAYYTVDPPETARNPAGSYAGPDGLGNRYVQLVRYTVNTVAGQLQVRPDSETVLLGGAGRSLADVSGGGTLLNDENFSQPSSGIRPDGTNIDDYIAADSITHAGGDAEFGPDGALYVSVGDGAYFGSADSRVTRTHDIGNLSGKVLRVDPLTGDGLPDNPFFVAGQPNANQSKVYQLGLRNPFRVAFDPDGDLFLGEVGWYSWEEINTGGPGANFGWPYTEGGQNSVNLPTPSFRDLPQAQAFYASGTPATAPFLAFSHIEADMGFSLQAITLGEVYTGSQYPGVLRGDLFFASLTSGQVFSVDTNDPARTVNLIATQNATIVSIGQGPDGVLYYADIAGGTIGRWQINAEAPSATYNGDTVSLSARELLSQGPAFIGFSDTGSTTISAEPDALIGFSDTDSIAISAEPDALMLRLQQDAYQGDAQLTVSFNSAQGSGTLTTQATHASGQFDTWMDTVNL